ncbi:hypothetical protein, partial [Frankia sp. EI5c]
MTVNAGGLEPVEQSGPVARRGRRVAIAGAGK